MAGISRSLGWRHVLVAIVVVAGPLLAWRGWLGQPLRPERFDAKQIVVTPVGDDGLRIREVVDQDFGSFQRHGYERRIPNDYGVPVDVEASSPDAPADVSVGQDPERTNWTRIRVGDPAVTVGGQHRYVLSYTLPATRVGSGDLSLDIIGTDETLETESFEVIVAGMELEDPECRITDGTCELVRDGDVYRAELGTVAAGRGHHDRRDRHRAVRGGAARPARRCPSGAATATAPCRWRPCCCRSAPPARPASTRSPGAGAATTSTPAGPPTPRSAPGACRRPGARRSPSRRSPTTAWTTSRRRSSSRRAASCHGSARCCCASGSTPTPSAPGSPATPPATS